MKFSPQEAIIAVTLNCNSRCVMCDIWQNRMRNEVKPGFYRKLPPLLREINLTGGEPFLRLDLPQIVKVIKKRCPQARIVVSTNGFLPKVIKRLIPEMVRYDPSLAVRVSLDGLEKKHEQIRGIKGGYKLILESLDYLREYISDLGIGFTLMEQNKKELLKVYQFCQKNNFQFSLTLASDSVIYFGLGKSKLRPKKTNKVKNIFKELIWQQSCSLRPKDWLRAWFNQQLFKFFMMGKRTLSCQAGRDFFYLDSYGRVFVCHLKPWLLGDLKKNSFGQIFSSAKADRLRQKASLCHDCWMSCSTRSAMKRHFLRVGGEVLQNQFKYRLKL